MLRELQIKKDNIQNQMSGLWDIREKGETWTKEQETSYDNLVSQNEQVNKDIKRRGEFMENFKRGKIKRR